MNKSLVKLDRQERFIFDTIKGITTVIFSLVKAILVGVYWTISTLANYASNYKYYKNVGYTPFDIMDKVEKMNSRQFEFFCAELFKACGYAAKVTKAQNDYGRDIILNKGGETIFVECKHYKGVVGREICQKLLGSVNMFGVDKAIVITTGRFNKNAYEVQKMVGEDKLELIDSTGILDMIKMMDKECIPKMMMKSLSA